MKRYKVTILVPHEREFEATDTQDAHNKVTQMMEAAVSSGELESKVHSIIEMVDPEPIDFGAAPE